MITLDRSTAPQISTIDKIDIIKGVPHTLSNGLTLHTIDCDTEEMVKIDWLFKAGAWAADRPCLSSFTANMLAEGTKNKTAKEIAGIFDFYGAIFRPASDADKVTITLFCLNKHLDKVLPLVKEIIEEAVFPQEELDIYRQKKINQLKVNLNKGDYVAKNIFDQSLFGQDHPYGYFLKVEDMQAITREALIEFHENYYQYKACQVIVSGKIPANFIDQFSSLFGNNTGNKTFEEKKRFPKPAVQKEHLFPMEDSVQAAIAFGKPSLHKSHPDFAGLLVLNTVLGGYFGSRLMANIREDKGYTYGIYSAVVPYIRESYQYIATEVDKNVYKDALNEIKLEIKRLQDELIPEEELTVVRNYLIGSFLSSIDGPFALSNRLKGILLFDMDYDYYDNFIDTIKNISAERLREIAKEHMCLDDYHEVVAV